MTAVFASRFVEQRWLYDTGATGWLEFIVQELLGHSTTAITLDTYSHVLPSMGDAAARTMDEALG